MQQNRVKRVIREGGLAIGTYLSIPHPIVVELIGLGGFDAVFIDLEHSPVDWGTLDSLLRAADLAGITPLVRVAENNPATIGQILDLGATGIVVPHIANAEDARRAVDAVRYPPLGHRGVGGGRTSAYGAMGGPAHQAEANREIVLSVMMEDANALADVRNIAAVPGLDLVAIGPSDMSSALGVTGLNEPKLVNAVKEAARAVREAGNARFSIPLSHPNLSLPPKELVAMGVGYSNTGPAAASRLLSSYSEQTKKVRESLR